jgi:hypothetical protein
MATEQPGKSHSNAFSASRTFSAEGDASNVSKMTFSPCVLLRADLYQYLDSMSRTDSEGHSLIMSANKQSCILFGYVKDKKIFAFKSREFGQ